MPEFLIREEIDESLLIYEMEFQINDVLSILLSEAKGKKNKEAVLRNTLATANMIEEVSSQVGIYREEIPKRLPLRE